MIDESMANLLSNLRQSMEITQKWIPVEIEVRKL